MITCKYLNFQVHIKFILKNKINLQKYKCVLRICLYQCTKDTEMVKINALDLALITQDHEIAFQLSDPAVDVRLGRLFMHICI
jgi:hypothetical protein